MPLNYYNELIGIVVDTTIIKLLIKKLIPDLSDIIEDKNDFIGDFIGNNFINRGLTNLFSNGMIDKEVSLLIWDYLFIDGNKVLLKSFLAIYYYLSDIIINGEQSIEFYNEVINKEVKKLKIDNEDFIYNLFFKNDDAISAMKLNEKRFYLSLQVADSLEEQNLEHVKSKVKLSYDTKLYNNQINKALTCNKKWPYCISDTYFENVTRTVFYSVFHEINNNYIDNYFFSDKINEEKKEKHKSKIVKNNIFEIRVERRPHYCSQIQNEINEIKSIEENNKEKENQKEIKDNKNNKINNDINKELKESGPINKLIHRAISRKDFSDVTKAIENEIDLQINNLENK